jgi:adenylate cyclase
VRYRFDNCTLDLKRGCLSVADREVEMRPKGFAMLRHLVESAGRLVTKDEAVAAVWGATAVTDDSLARCISDVRAAIADRHHRVIKTVPRRGYIFTSNVTGEEQVDARMEDIDAAAPISLTEDQASIAVLAFTNLSGDPREEYLSDGITEDIITELSRFSELSVIARNSTFQFKGKPVDVRHIGRELRARYVLEGSVRREGKRVRVTAQLIDSTTGAHRWAERYDRTLGDMLNLQAELAGEIVSVLAVQVVKAEVERTRAKPPSDWQAHDCYLRATALAGTYQSTLNREQLHESRRLLRKALEFDRDYARAHSALALGYVSSWVHRWDDDCPWPAAIDRAYDSAHSAVLLAPNLPEAYVSLGCVLSFKRQHEAAVAAFERAILLNPNFTNWRFPFALILAGEPARAIDALGAHMSLDPFYEPQAPGLMGFAYFMLQRYDEALVHLRQCVARAPGLRLVRLWLAATHARLGDKTNAKSEALEVLKIDPAYTIDGWARLFLPFKLAQDAQHFFGSLREAGIPDK